MNLHQHPLSAAFPGMQEREFEELIRDIEEHGQLEPIILFEGMVLDGWHRYRACLELDREPTCSPLPDGQDPVSFVQSKNLHRRHLTETQRTAAVVACSEWAPAHRPEKGAPGRPSTVKEMAETAQTSERTVQRVKKGIEAGLGEAMRDGKVTAKEAEKLAKLPEPERQAALEAPAPPKPAPQPRESGNTGLDLALQLIRTAFAIPQDEAIVPFLKDLLETRETEVSSLKEQLASKDAQIADLERRLSEAGEQIQELHEDLNAAKDALDAEDLLARFEKEVSAVGARARQAESRLRAMQGSVRDAQHMAKMWKGKFEKLEKQQAKAKKPETEEVVS